MSVSSCSHGRDGKSGCSMGNFYCVVWCLLQVGHPFTVFRWCSWCYSWFVARILILSLVVSIWISLGARCVEGLGSLFWALLGLRSSLLWRPVLSLVASRTRTSIIPIIIGGGGGVSVANHCTLTVSFRKFIVESHAVVSLMFAMSIRFFVTAMKCTSHSCVLVFGIGFLLKETLDRSSSATGINLPGLYFTLLSNFGHLWMNLCSREGVSAGFLLKHLL